MTETEQDEKLIISPRDLAKILTSGEKVKLLDVRSEMEYQMLHIDGATLATRPLVEEIFTKWPKETAIVVYDHFGKAGLDAAHAMAGRGFTQVKYLEGGIDAWSKDVDPLIPRY